MAKKTDKIQYRVKPSKLQGEITIPSSKSHTLRAILFASLAHGRSTIKCYLKSPDTEAMIHACELLGAKIEVAQDEMIIVGTSGKPRVPPNVIDAGNSGQVLRFIAAIASLTSGYTVLTGDASIRHLRPVKPLLDGLTGLGVFAVSTQDNGTAPIIVKGPIQGGQTQLNGTDSQPVSALLIASAFAQEKTIIEVSDPGELPWIDLTLDWLRRLGIRYERQGYTRYTVFGHATYPGFEYTVPGDFSSCAFPLIAALITQSPLSLHNLDMQDVQGDKAIIGLLQDLGAKIVVNAAERILEVMPSGKLRGAEINANAYIDALPILAVLACFAESETTIYGASIARKKESDRISAIAQTLSAMGASIIELEDGLKIRPAALFGARVHSFADHRIAMALAVAGLGAVSGETIIDDVRCVAKSYPDFLPAMQQLGVDIETI